MRLSIQRVRRERVSVHCQRNNMVRVIMMNDEHTVMVIMVLEVRMMMNMMMIMVLTRVMMLNRRLMLNLLIKKMMKS